MRITTAALYYFIVHTTIYDLTAAQPLINLQHFEENLLHQLRRQASYKSILDVVEERYFTQKLDHFSVLDDRTWQQRYFISNDSYVLGGPVFLFVSGEWEADPAEVTETFVGELAAEHGAFLINLEHRYYGHSRPTEDTSSANLRFLNADQALEDVATFTLATMSDPELNLTGPWVIIGKSYSGQISSWSRARYPHLFHSAIASSATVLAKLDVPEYMEVVGEALRVTHPNCPVVISDAMIELQALVEVGAAENITQLFNLCTTLNLEVPEDVMSLYLYIALAFSYQVQYAKHGSLSATCAPLLLGQSRPLETVATVIRAAYPRCLLTETDVVLSYFARNTSWEFPILRQYYYQMCVEYGQYMSLSSPDQPFGQVVPVDLYLLWCPNVFGPEFTRELNEEGIARTNLVYGGVNPEVTRVIYTHGSLDPWYPIGILQDLDPDTPVIMIDGESHCRDLDVTSDQDSQALKDARIRISQILTDWL